MDLNSSTRAALCTPKEVTLGVLAGGQGSRMGRPKGLLELDGRPILRYLLDQFAWPGPTMLVTAPSFEHPPGWQCFDDEVSDPVAGEGPLRGMLTALESAKTELVAVATVDMPGVGSEQVLWLIHELHSRAEWLGAMPAKVGKPGEAEPFPCALRRSAAAVIRQMLVAGQRAVHRIARDPRFGVLVPATEWPASTWTNLNSPQDLQAWNHNV